MTAPEDPFPTLDQCDDLLVASFESFKLRHERLESLGRFILRRDAESPWTSFASFVARLNPETMRHGFTTQSWSVDVKAILGRVAARGDRAEIIHGLLDEFDAELLKFETHLFSHSPADTVPRFDQFPLLATNPATA